MICLHKRIPIALACVLAVLSGRNVVLAEDQPTEAQILEALKAHGPARDAHDSAGDREPGSDERQFLEALRKKNLRTITIDDRRRVAEIVSRSPSIDLDVTFANNSAIIGPGAVPTLVTLGRALGRPELKGATFLIGGHTDAAGSDGYNQSLSERRAEAVKTFLAEQFKLSPDQMLAIGFGRSELKNTADPMAAENRRVQIVTIEQQACTTQLQPSPQHYTARVTRFLSEQEVLSITRTVEGREQARISPAYFPLRRVYTQVSQPDGSAAFTTMAAIPEYMTVNVGDVVELSSRYRDPALPCNFIPWTINRIIINEGTAGR
jgi:outer membrane protein OmpA-like peptidoglycan-associated protein